MIIDCLDWPKKRKSIHHKLDMICKLLSQNESDLLQESVALIEPLFSNAELSIYSMSKQEIVYSSALNKDVLAAIKTTIEKIRIYTEPTLIEPINSNFFRPGVVYAKQVPLGNKKDLSHILFIEFYDKKKQINDTELVSLYNLLTIAVRLHCLEFISKDAINLDSMTLLPTRDALVKRLKETKQEKFGYQAYCLAIISVVNTEELNNKYGMPYVDEILKNIGIYLKKKVGKDIYRIGGTKFAVLLREELYDANVIMEKIVDEISEIDKDIITATVLTSCKEDVYISIFICESNLKNVSEDVVTVVREKITPEDVHKFEEVVDTYLPHEVKNVKETSSINSDIEVVDREDLEKDHEPHGDIGSESEADNDTEIEDEPKQADFFTLFMEGELSEK